MKISKIKAALALLTGGLGGAIKYLLDVINTQLLGKIPNKETAAKYLRDVQAVDALLRAILGNHASDISEKRKECMEAILEALAELSKALEDFTITEDELDFIIVKVNAAIDAFKKAK